MTRQITWFLPFAEEEDISTRRKKTYDAMIPILEDHFGTRSVRILEIGVHRAGFIEALFSKSTLNIDSFEGVDPYLGRTGDMYLGSYWKNKHEADECFHYAQDIYDRYNQQLHRMTSNDFFKTLNRDTSFDLIFADGDHRFSQALWDISTYFYQLVESGLLVIDDHANTDVPDVTRAFNPQISQITRITLIT